MLRASVGWESNYFRGRGNEAGHWLYWVESYVGCVLVLMGQLWASFWATKELVKLAVIWVCYLEPI